MAHECFLEYLGRHAYIKEAHYLKIWANDSDSFIIHIKDVHFWPPADVITCN